jgi:hypothetical protein
MVCVRLGVAREKAVATAALEKVAAAASQGGSEGSVGRGSGCRRLLVARRAGIHDGEDLGLLSRALPFAMMNPPTLTLVQATLIKADA